MIARDAGWMVNPGLEGYDKNGHKVGYVDQASDARGWTQVEAESLGLQRLWIPLLRSPGACRRRRAVAVGLLGLHGGDLKSRLRVVLDAAVRWVQADASSKRTNRSLQTH